jgi:integrase
MARKKLPTAKNTNGEGSVWHDKNRDVWKWELTLGYTPDGKRRAARGRADSEEAAGDALTQARADYLRGILADPDNITVSEYAGKWLARQKGVRSISRLAYQGDLRYALEIIGSLKVRAVKPLHIREMLSTLADKEMKSGMGNGRTMASRTLAAVLARVKAVFRDAVIDEIMYKDPTLGVKRIKPARNEHPGIALDFDEVASLHELGTALYAAGVCRLWPALFTALAVGLRRGEVMALRWSDIDFKTNTLKVRQSVSIPNGKPVMNTGKTVNAARDIPMTSSLVAMLEQVKTAQEHERKHAGDSWVNTGAVFATELGQYTHPDQLGKALNGLLAWSNPNAVKAQPKKRKTTAKARTRKRPLDERSRLERRLFGVPVSHRAALEATLRAIEPIQAISPHDLRHTAGTLMLRRGMPVEVVSKILGHADIAITYSVYRHVFESEKRAAIVDLFDVPLPVRTVQIQAMN